MFSTLPTVIRPTDRSQPTGASGTGFFIASNGAILTVAHVVRTCRGIAVWSQYVKETPARLLAIDYRDDLAVVQVKIPRPPALLAMAERPVRAENLTIFGYPGDGDKFVPTAIAGRLYIERPSFEPKNRRGLLWMDANAVGQGYSGGPVLNTAGDVVGLIDGHVVQRTSVDGAVARETKYVFGVATDTIAAFLARELPALNPDAGHSPPPQETDRAVVRVVCWQ